MMKKITSLTIIFSIVLLAFSCLVAAQAKDVTIGQKNKTFIFNDKPVEAVKVKVGDTVYFMNNDPWFHNIFSLSEFKTFDLGSYPQGESRPVTFDARGTFEVECAIHPNMFLEVTVE